MTLDETLQKLGYNTQDWSEDMKCEAILNHTKQLNQTIKTLVDTNTRTYAIAREYAYKLSRLGQETYIPTETINLLKEQTRKAFLDERS